MSTFFLYLFIGLCLGLLFKVIQKPALIYEYPYFISFIFFIFILPQAVIIYTQPRLIPINSELPLFAVCLLCLGMAVAGYFLAPSINLGKSLLVPLNEKKVKQIALVYTLLGYLFLYLINKRLSELKEVATQWSGVLTIYVQLFHFINIAFPILLYKTLRRFSTQNLILTIVSALPALYFILAAGRREVTALFLLTIALSLFFKNKIAPSKILIVGAILFATLIIPATGDYRKVAEKEGPIAAIQSLDLQQGFINYFNEGKYLELAVAAYIIDSYSFHGEYLYGAGYWDNLVFRYVPGQILGQKFKQSLMINKDGVKYRNGYRMYTGLTPTGVGDSFIQFSYLGCFFFFFLGGLFRSLWQSSFSENGMLLQILYIMCVVQAMLAVTHQTINFLPGILFSYICLWLVAWYAKEKE